MRKKTRNLLRAANARRSPRKPTLAKRAQFHVKAKQAKQKAKPMATKHHEEAEVHEAPKTKLPEEDPEPVKLAKVIEHLGKHGAPPAQWVIDAAWEVAGGKPAQ